MKATLRQEFGVVPQKIFRVLPGVAGLHRVALRIVPALADRVGGLHLLRSHLIGVGPADGHAVRVGSGVHIGRAFVAYANRLLESFIFVRAVVGTEGSLL